MKRNSCFQCGCFNYNGSPLSQNEVVPNESEQVVSNRSTNKGYVSLIEKWNKNKGTNTHMIIYTCKTIRSNKRGYTYL